VVLNEDPGSEQHDSLRLGLAALPEDSAGVAVLPVDFPLVRAETVERLIEVFRSSSTLIARPVHGRQPGHPTIFSRTLYGELSRIGLPEGARTVIAHHQGSI